MYGRLKPYADVLGVDEDNLLRVYIEGDPTRLASPAYVSKEIYDKINDGAFIRVVDAATVHRGEGTLVCRRGELTVIG